MNIFKELFDLARNLQTSILRRIVRSWYFLTTIFIFLFIFILLFLLHRSRFGPTTGSSTFLLLLWSLCLLLLRLRCSNMYLIFLLIRVDLLAVINFNSEIKRLILNFLTLDIALASRRSSFLLRLLLLWLRLLLVGATIGYLLRASTDRR